jgi:hypothetical protein
MIGKIGFNRLRQPQGRGFFAACASSDSSLSTNSITRPGLIAGANSIASPGFIAGAHWRLYQPCRARRLVMWAT